MKIAYVYDAVYPWIKGGIEKRVYELSRRLASRGNEVHCFGIKWWKGDSTILRDGVYLHGICSPRSLYSGDRRSISEAIAFASRLLVSLRGNFDLIDCQQFPYIPCFSAKMIAAGGPELFITWHEVWGDYWYEYLGKKGVIGRSIEVAVSKLTDKNIAVSEMTKRELERLGVGGVAVVPNGVDIKEIEQIEASEEKSDIIYAGRLIGHKNVDLLIRAIARVKQQTPDIKAIIVGDGPEAAYLNHLANDLGLDDNIKFCGFMENYDHVISLMKSSRVFVMPSTREGFGLAVIEANACGLPVITVDHRMNAVCDLVTKETGAICNLSEEELSRTIMEVLNKGETRGAGHMRDKCIELARRYDWDEICSLVEKIYKVD